MPDYINSWSKWVILKDLCLVFYKKTYFRRIKDLAKELGNIQIKYLYSILDNLEKLKIIEVKKEGDIKSITVLSKSKMRDEVVNTKFMQEFIEFEKETRSEFLIPGLKQKRI